jgi:O-methyltransferase
MQDKSMNFLCPVFFGVKAPEFHQGLQQAISNSVTGGMFTGDNVFTIGRNLGFLEDKVFMAAREKHAQTDIEKAIIWRNYVQCWAARSVLARNIAGDFVDCGCYKGVSVGIVCDYVDFRNSGRQYYLYDLFEHDDAMIHHAMPEHGAGLFEEVRKRFSDYQNVTVTKGFVPQILDEIAPERIAFLHIDLNNAPAEIGALDRLFDRLSPGGILLFDDYGWLAYRAQKEAEDPWLAQRGYQVLELPTGQGLVFK